MLKLPFVLGLGVGYVLGARAGRDRYEQIMNLAQRTKENPTVANAAGTVMHRGEEVLKDAKTKAAEKAPDWMPGSQPSGSQPSGSQPTGSQSSGSQSSGSGSKNTGDTKVTVHAATSNGAVTEASPGDMPGAAPGHT